MTIVRWMPFQEVDSMERRVRRIFEDIGFPPKLLPAADIYETADEFVVELEVPGYDAKELGIEVTDHTLTIKGERKQFEETKEKTLRLHERLEKDFERRFFLPAEADTQLLKASFAKGVLEVHAPKAKTAKPRRVQITKA